MKKLTTLFTLIIISKASFASCYSDNNLTFENGSMQICLESQRIISFLKGEVNALPETNCYSYHGLSFADGSLQNCLKLQEIIRNINNN